MSARIYKFEKPNPVLEELDRRGIEMQERIERANRKMEELPFEEFFAYKVLRACRYASAVGPAMPDVLGKLLEELAATQGKCLPDYNSMKVQARENPIEATLAILEWLGIPNPEKHLANALEKIEGESK